MYVCELGQQAGGRTVVCESGELLVGFVDGGGAAWEGVSLVERDEEETNGPKRREWERRGDGRVRTHISRAATPVRRVALDRHIFSYLDVSMFQRRRRCGGADANASQIPDSKILVSICRMRRSNGD
jgi:hypothetical protein